MDLSRAIPVVVTDRPAETRAFYEQVLGMGVAMDEDGFLMLVSSSSPSIQVIVAWESPTAWDPLATSLDLSIDVGTPENVQAVHAAAVAAGLEVVYPLTDEAFGRRRCAIREPSGAVVNIACHV